MKGKAHAGEGITETYSKEPKTVPNAKTGGYPATGVKAASWERRGSNAQTKARKAAGPKA
jgi:hypothetical protein